MSAPFRFTPRVRFNLGVRQPSAIGDEREAASRGRERSNWSATAAQGIVAAQAGLAQREVTHTLEE